MKRLAEYRYVVVHMELGRKGGRKEGGGSFDKAGPKLVVGRSACTGHNTVQTTRILK